MQQQFIDFLFYLDIALGIIVAIILNTLLALCLKTILDLPKWIKVIVLIPPIMFILLLNGCFFAGWEKIVERFRKSKKAWNWYYNDEEDEDLDAIF